MNWSGVEGHAELKRHRTHQEITSLHGCGGELVNQNKLRTERHHVGVGIKSDLQFKLTITRTSENAMKRIKSLFRYLFGHCAYCGSLLRIGGGRGFGTPHKVFSNEKRGDIVQYACLNCEMGFDDE